jgi:hypothetical protein
MSAPTLVQERGVDAESEVPVRTILDPRFPQPGRYSEYGVPEILRPAVDALYTALTHSSELSAEELLVERALLRLLEPWSRWARPRASS